MAQLYHVWTQHKDFHDKIMPGTLVVILPANDLGLPIWSPWNSKLDLYISHGKFVKTHLSGYAAHIEVIEPVKYPALIGKVCNKMFQEAISISWLQLLMHAMNCLSQRTPYQRQKDSCDLCLSSIIVYNNYANSWHHVWEFIIVICLLSTPQQVSIFLEIEKTITNRLDFDLKNSSIFVLNWCKSEMYL